MITKNIFHIINVRWIFCAVSLGMLALTGCAVEPGGAVAYVGPPVIVAPEPVIVGPEVIVPVEVGGGRDRDRR